MLLVCPDLLPPACEVKPPGIKDHAYLVPGMDAPVRVTTDPGFYEQHADSVELWSPGSPLFPDMKEEGIEDTVDGEKFRKILKG
jgi:hypothetical protein